MSHKLHDLRNRARVSRRRLLGAGAAGTAGTWLAACTQTQGSAGDTSRAAATVAPASIRFTYWGADPEEIQVEDTVIAAFAKKAPQIKVENSDAAAGTSPYQDKLVASAAAGTAPDVARISSQDMPKFAKNGLLVPLDDIVKRDGYKLNDFWAGV